MPAKKKAPAAKKATKNKKATAVMKKKATAVMKKKATAVMKKKATAVVKKKATAVVKKKATAVAKKKATAVVKKKATAVAKKKATADVKVVKKEALAPTVSIDAFFEAAIEASRAVIEEHGRGHSSFTDEGLAAACTLRARRNEPAGLDQLLREMHEPANALSAAMRAIAALAPANEPAARQLFERHEKTLAEMYKHGKAKGLWATSNPRELMPHLAGPAAVALAALGDAKASAAWYARARETIEPDYNFWQKRFIVSWAALETGRDGDIAELWGPDFWQRPPNDHHFAPWGSYLVRTKRLSVLEQFLKLWSDADEGLPHEVLPSLKRQLLALGRVADVLRLSDFAKSIDRHLLSDEEKRKLKSLPSVVNAETRQPTPEERAALVERFKDAKKRKSVSESIVFDALDVGEHALALEALPKIRALYRYDVAYRALWRLETASDALPW
jgi:hypothetical protein